MEKQFVIINGRPKRAFKKFGKEFIRCLYDIEVNEGSKFATKCDYLNQTDSGMVRELIREFNISYGYDETVQQAGALFDNRPEKHIKDSIKKVIKKQFPFLFSEN